MQARFLLGPAGSGKTFRCLSEIRRALVAASEGPPLLLISPKQNTYQLEHQLLSDSQVAGYTRLQILSVERLAKFVFDLLKQRPPDILGEGGRLMVLRALLTKHREQLKVFRASARLTGFAAELGLVLRELQRNNITQDTLRAVAEKVHSPGGLGAKLQDLATMLELYSEWLAAHHLQDPEFLLHAAARSLHDQRANENSPIAEAHGIAGLWVDGFAEYSAQELDLLTAIAPLCSQITLTFSLDALPAQKAPWLSNWHLTQHALEACQKHFKEIPGMQINFETLDRNHVHGRFENQPYLRHLERNWNDQIPFQLITTSAERSLKIRSREIATVAPLSKSLRVVSCKDHEAEATLAAREILRHVRMGGRYREIAVLVRKLQPYHGALQRVFSRYEIPFFLDRREPVAHHPLLEFTRNALRVVVLNWQTEDLFAAFKTGLTQVAEEDIDQLENEALVRGWNGTAWLKPFVIPDDPDLQQWIKNVLDKLLPPFQHLALSLKAKGSKCNGPELSEALRQFWREFKIEEQIEKLTAPDPTATDSTFASPVHGTVWTDLNELLTNVELAFSDESIPLKEWLSVLEAGLANLTVGVIPPALDQVLIGAIDRSRDPEIKLALVMGLNESVFPALPDTGVLLTDTDRTDLERFDLLANTSGRRQLSRERYYAYIAFTRASQRLVLTSALHNAEGSPLNPSPFLAQLKALFPDLTVENHPSGIDSGEIEHLNELIVPLLGVQKAPDAPGADEQLMQQISKLPGAATRLKEVSRITMRETDSLPAELVQKLYGPVLRTSVSRLEVFAACQFRFLIHSGLRAEERRLFELDVREQGSFQHDALAQFHAELEEEKLRWRDISPAEARSRIGQIAESLMVTYRDGLLQATEQSRFLGRAITASLQDFIETLVEWMGSQYQFDPVAVELPFGEKEGLPAHEIPLDKANRLALTGRIDRVDLLRDANSEKTRVVVVDYKSRQKQLDKLLVENGLQLQLLTYLNVLRRLKSPEDLWGAAQLIPSGVFYVSLRGKYERKSNRDEALADLKAARRLAYQHSGRFDLAALPHLDSRAKTEGGDQFAYRVTAKGRTSREALASTEFEALLNQVEAVIIEMGREIYSGSIKISPYRKGTLSACDHCDYRSICRIDPWTHSFRVLRAKD